MANYDPCFIEMIRMEGGYTLHEVKGDTGGLTYAGISYNNHPNWIGWTKIENEEFDDLLTGLVKTFYRKHFWNKIRGDDIESQIVAQNIFTFAVNAGVKAASRLVQHIIGSTPDGIIGPKSIALLNGFINDDKDEKIFVLMYALSKVFRYKNICLNDKRRSKDSYHSNMKFILGWINRVENGLKGA